MKKSLNWILLITVAVIIILSGSTGIAAPKGKITVGSSQGSMELRKVFDPHTAFGATPTTFKCLVFDGLTARDENGKTYPALSESWKIAADWSSITFTLKKGIKFNNGEALTAEDVKFSFERAMREDLRFLFGGEMRRSVESIDVINDYVVRLNLKSPYPAVLDRSYEYLAIVPKDYVEKVGDDEFAAKPVGAGPFNVIDFKRDVYMDFEAVDNHYRKTANIKHLKYMIVPEHSTRLAMVKTGEADMIMAISTQIPNIQKDKNLRMKLSKHTYLRTLVFFDLAHPEDSPFKDKRVRRAVSLAIDRQGIADAVSFGSNEPWGSFLAPYHYGYDPSRKPDPYDPQQAKNLLAEAGYANGFDTTLTCSPTLVPMFEPIVQNLKDVGINAKFVVPEQGTWGKQFAAAKFRGIGFGSGPWWAGRAHPAVALQSHITGSSSHNLATPAIQAAMDELEGASEEADVTRLARKLEVAIFNDLPRIPLWSNHAIYALGPRIKEYLGIPGVVHPMNFEYLKLND